VIEAELGLESQVAGARCPCCGTAMVVVSEDERKVSLSCPSCHVSDIRMK
jgi:Zn finger protein HypA/HybF involved in hydrogenase expression